jgi:hypothetical protein
MKGHSLGGSAVPERGSVNPAQEIALRTRFTALMAVALLLSRGKDGDEE